MHTETCLALGWLFLHGKSKTWLILIYQFLTSNSCHFFTIFFACLQFSDPRGVSGGGSRGHRGHDSFEGGGGHSVLSSAATMAIDNSVTEEPSTSAGTTDVYSFLPNIGPGRLFFLGQNPINNYFQRQIPIGSVIWKSKKYFLHTCLFKSQWKLNFNSLQQLKTTKARLFVVVSCKNSI